MSNRNGFLFNLIFNIFLGTTHLAARFHKNIYTKYRSHFFIKLSSIKCGATDLSKSRLQARRTVCLCRPHVVKNEIGRKKNRSRA